jgi:hypothetical protein
MLRKKVTLLIKKLVLLHYGHFMAKQLFPFELPLYNRNLSVFILSCNLSLTVYVCAHVFMHC